VTLEGQERSRMRCMELTEALVTEDITPFERERLREALEEEVRRQLPADRRLVRVVDWVVLNEIRAFGRLRGGPEQFRSQHLWLQNHDLH
jgi:hypothetical protein